MLRIHWLRSAEGSRSAKKSELGAQALFGPPMSRRRLYQCVLYLLCVSLFIGFGWLGATLSHVMKRRAAIAQIQSQGGIVQYFESTTSSSSDPQWFQEKLRCCPSTVRQWLGDPPVHYINVSVRRCKPQFAWSDRERFQRLFPEASVVPEKQSAFPQ